MLILYASIPNVAFLSVSGLLDSPKGGQSSVEVSFFLINFPPLPFEVDIRQSSIEVSSLYAFFLINFTLLYTASMLIGFGACPLSGFVLSFV